MTLEQFAEMFPQLQYAHLKIIERCVAGCKDGGLRYLDLLASINTHETLVSTLAINRIIWHCERRAIVIMGEKEYDEQQGR